VNFGFVDVIQDSQVDFENERLLFLQSLQSGQFFENLFDCVPGVFYFVKNKKGQFIACSLGFAKALSCQSVEDLLGKTDYDFTPNFLADGFVADDRKVLESKKPIYNKVELVPTSTGSLDWLSTSKIPLISKQGEAVGIAGITRILLDSEAFYSNSPEMREIIQYIRDHFSEKISMAETASIGNVSVSTQERLFKSTFNITPNMFLRKIRLNAACAHLRNSDLSIPKIAVQCGLNDQTNMTRAFRIELKITPLQYRKRFSQNKEREK